MSEMHQGFFNRFRKIENFSGDIYNCKIFNQVIGIGLTLISIIFFTYLNIIEKEIPGERQLLILLIIYIFMLWRYKWGSANYWTAAVYILYYLSDIFIEKEIVVSSLLNGLILFVIILGMEKIKLSWSNNYKRDYDIEITKRRRAEKELRRSFEEKGRLLDKAYEYEQIKNEFFANISHELRTPLNVILSAIQIMVLCLNEENQSNNKLMRYINMIRQNCYRLLRLVNNLIDISKIDAGFYEIHPQNHNIVSIVEDITQSVVEYAREKNINIQFDTDTEEKIMALDPDKIERIVLNILSNSIKFTEAGGNIFVSLLDEGENIKIIFKDTGIGIPEDKLDIIFERFKQAHKSLIKNNQGSGIGLSLVKSLVKLHDGEINVFSKEGEGTEFVIEFPVRLINNNRNGENKVVLSSHEQSKIERINIEFSDIYSGHQ